MKKTNLDRLAISWALEGSRTADFIENRIREALGQKESVATGNVELVFP